ncbi:MULTISPECIES: SDR family NAD(P)-dependent oxidoreductase [Anoxybacillus]|uniref:SDR family NAD(P)-dependent oxidoreductase n=1 Tax=Anoxybacillus TaxID=150247 RepID=UPI0009DE10A3|nr:SDR family NAD(P)-dependent oxidoreductase [Anoxybacillus gonensis]
MSLLRLFFITGVSRGLGYSLFKKLLLQDKAFIVIIGRRFTEDQIQLSKVHPNKIKLVIYDLSHTPSSNPFENTLNKEFFEKFNEIVFINNAGVVEPIKRLGRIEDDEMIFKHININYASVVYILNVILKNKPRNMPMKILNITSGAAERSIPGWSLYCSSKKAIKTFLDVLKDEYKQITVFHIDPGVMDTGMQEVIRKSDKEDFPLLETFQSYKKLGQLKSPDEVAIDILKGYLK